jgi:radical SAM protein with 4Fe4S-binding SPASM domain
VRARAEPFGAWVRLDDATLVAVTPAAARRLGIDGGTLWNGVDDGPRPPLEVHVSVTSRCGAGCKGCYVDARPDGHEPPRAALEAILAAVADAGAFTVAFGGGEPLGRDDLGELAAAARARGLTPVLTTSGIGMTRAVAERLAGFAQVNVSYDGAGDDYATVRGYDGARVAERAMALLAEAGVPFGVNVVLTRATFERLGATLARAEALGAREAQLLRYKPAGRARSAEYIAARLSPPQIEALLPTLEALASERSIALRIDCALVPFLSAHAVDASALARFGVFGCEAGRHLAAARADGAVAPCSFAPSAEIDAILAWSGGGWASAPTLEAWRTTPPEEPCASCPIRGACRGGCKVVASHLDGRLGPDPECPRVRAHRAAGREVEHATG